MHPLRPIEFFILHFAFYSSAYTHPRILHASATRDTDTM